MNYYVILLKGDDFMPATITHAFFTMDVYQKLSNRERLLTADDMAQLRMFGQSTDSMMFYNIETLKRGKKLRKFQYSFHTTKTQKFFTCLCQYIKKHQLFECHDVLAFLYGFICHYVLDSNVHPYIIYKTGIMEKGVKETYRYNNLHAYMETFLDNEMIAYQTKEKIYAFRSDQFCFDSRKFSKDLNKLINDVFEEVFDIKQMAKIYYDSLKQMKRFLRRYRYDQYGIKMMTYQFIDLFTGPSMFKLKALSYHYPNQNREYFLNHTRAIWYNPVDPSLSSHDSFFDLYQKSVSEACSIIHEVNLYFHGKSIDLKKVFTNKSYLSGLNCDIPLQYKKFAF